METRTSFWQRNSIIIKMIIVGILILLLLIPSSMIRGLIYERQEYQGQVINEVAGKWGRQQVISGPVISIPFILKQYNQNPVVEYAHFLPETFNAEGTLNAQYRSRNIFKVIGYRGNISISGQLRKPDLGSFGKQIQANMDVTGAVIQLPVSDLKGIKTKVMLIIDGKPFEMNPGLTIHDISSSGLWCKISLDEIFKDKDLVNYEIKMEKLGGTQRISFLPVGKETSVSIECNWGSPSFDGGFIPDSRSINDTSFAATWKVLNLNRNYPQQFYGSNSSIEESEFGVSLIQPVDHYSLSERSAKYAILFISLTFLTFFFSEITSGKKIHPVHYILIGLALVLFFSLLLSLSEQIGFNKAYLSAASATIILVVLYAYSILKNLRITAVIGGLLTMLYGFIYIILQLEKMALLFGSIGLFVILAMVMYISRKIDWYNTGNKNSQ